jgi:L-lactate utilization protein LutC
MRALFERRLAALSGELVPANDEAAAAARLLELLRSTGPRVAAQAFPLLDRLKQASKELARELSGASDFPDDPVALAAYDVGLTRAEALVARTGSVYLTSTSAGGRQLSVLVPTHVVVATAAQLVPSIGDALATLERDAQASFATFITGPSRTADIEKILVLGAHGPKRLVVVLIDE